MKTSLRLALLILMTSLCHGCNDSSASASQTKAIAFPVGKVCQVTLDAQWLQERNGYVTPTRTRDNINGSKDSAWGTIVKVTDDWLVLEAANIKVDTLPNGETKTYGKAGELNTFEFWIPRDRILYCRVFAK